MARFRFPQMLAIGALVAVMPVAYAQSPGQATGEKTPDTQMMAMHQKMADMSAMNARLDALVTTMNAAKGEAKVDAIAETLTALVQQHRAMCDGMMSQMHGEMMPMAGAR